MKDSARMIRNYYFPEEIVIKVLLHLPMKAILRCKSVCKLWFEIIDSPKFGYKHSKNIKKSTASNVLLNCCQYHQLPTEAIPSMGNGFLPFLEQDNSSIALKSVKMPILWSLVNSCNGLVCLQGSESGTFQIMNPLYSITDVCEVKLPSDYYRAGSRYTFGFGFDELSHRFKIVSFMGCSQTGDDYSVRFLVHELGGSGWRKLSHSIGSLHLNFRYNKSPVFVDGCIHWLGTLSNRNNADGPTNSMASFNMANETLEIVSLPEEALRGRYSIDNLFDFKGSLGMAVRNWLRTDDDSSTVSVWVLCRDATNNEDNNKEITKQWINKFSFEFRLQLSNTVGFLEDCHILMRDNLYGRYSSYNTQTGICTCVPELPTNVTFMCHQGSLIRLSDLASISI